MKKFTQHSGVAAPLLRANVDTDAIIPSREMKRVSKVGLAEGLFAGWRYLEQDSREPDTSFVLNQPEYAGASILLSGDNFGCGSSREHAVWALAEYGIRSVIAPGFGGIFSGNCVRNGLLPVVMDEANIAEIAEWVEESPVEHLATIDLVSQNVLAGGHCFSFEVDADSKHMLIEGLDAIALTQTRWNEIAAFHVERKRLRPWLYS
ncbi:MAG: 3-isopropylmalate dehydratase small subunit [Halioglobus sp.]